MHIMRYYLLSFKSALCRLVQSIYFSRPFPFIHLSHSHNRLNSSVIRDAEGNMIPGDIIMRRFKGRVSNLFTRSYYTEGGVYIGNGKLVLQNQFGIQLLDIIDFCECDEIAVFRLNDEGRKQLPIENVIYRAKIFYEISQEHDFVFNHLDQGVSHFEICAYAYRELMLNREYDYVKGKCIDRSFNQDYRFEKLFSTNPRHILYRE